MNNQCQHGQLARVCELCDKDAEIAQLREYLDTAQRRASALGDEVAGLREAQIDYTVLHGFADKHRISYNELCVAVRAALAARKGEA